MIVLYNFNQQITPKQQKNFLEAARQGRGPGDPAPCDRRPTTIGRRSAKISGVKYHLDPWKRTAGTENAPAGRRVRFKIHVADPDHPITRGLNDYDLLDETYCRLTVDPACTSC